MSETAYGIPTKYQGRQYRSRLEARWAAMFDLLGWQVEYEPCDFNGWIPDFVISEADVVYVEVKPVSTFPQDVADEIDRSGCANEVLIVGQTILPDDCIGWLRERIEDTWDWSLATAGIWLGAESTRTGGRFRPGNPTGVIGFCHEVQSYRDRITGFYDGGCCGAGMLESRSLKAKWTEAGNIVQWNRPRGG